jgi:hypothetical protein
MRVPEPLYLAPFDALARAPHENFESFDMFGALRRTARFRRCRIVTPLDLLRHACRGLYDPCA